MHQPKQFYTYMNYPIPEPIEFFAQNKINISQTKIQRTDDNKQTEQYVKKIEKYHRLYKNIPFVKAIYLCDGMTFNATTNKSDIDLFFVVQDGCIRRARCISVLLFYILGLKRSFTTKSGKFDLIFYVTESQSNLKKLCISPYDPYLYHWLAHLIPIYTEDKNYNIYKNNTWLYEIFPNLPKYHHVIEMGLSCSHDKGLVKKLLEFLLSSHIREDMIKYVWKNNIDRKTQKRKHRLQDIIISDSVLKFHKDKREEIASKLIHIK